MLASTHVAAAAVLGYYVSSYTLIGIPAIYGIVAAGCALIPNADLLTQAAINRKKIRAPKIAAALRRKHLLHSPQFLALIWLLLRLLPFVDIWVADAFLVGTQSHIFLDLLTEGGAPLLYPDPKLHHLAHLRPGSPFETLILFPILAYGTLRMMLGFSPY